MSNHTLAYLCVKLNESKMKFCLLSSVRYISYYSLSPPPLILSHFTFISNGFFYIIHLNGIVYIPYVLVCGIYLFTRSH